MSIADVLLIKGRDVVRVGTTDTVRTAINLMATRRIGAVVVEDTSKHPIGLFSERDLLNAMVEHGPAALMFQVGRFTHARLMTCSPRDSVETIIAEMTMAKMRHLLVVDGGYLVGVVSIFDLVKHRLAETNRESNALFKDTRLHA